MNRSRSNESQRSRRVRAPIAYPTSQQLRHRQRLPHPLRLWQWVASGLVAIALLFASNHALATPTAEDLAWMWGDEIIAQAIESDRAPEDWGGLYADIAGERVAFILDNTAVDAQVSGNIARVEVRQTFTNPYERPLEAIYQFPLPEDAAVDEMEIQIGDLIVSGVD